MQFYVQPYDRKRRAKPETLELGRAAAQKAVSLDPSFSTARATLGSALVWAREYDAALTELRRALMLNPNDATTIGLYADALSRAGLHREAMVAFEEAAQLDPFPSPIALALKARAHILLRDFEPALVLARSSVEISPSFLPGLIVLAIAAIGLGREREARNASKRLLAAVPYFSAASHMALIGYRNSADAELLAGHLRRAGLPN
jgi:tetratricopeptide (TPR) repeat protein